MKDHQERGREMIKGLTAIINGNVFNVKENSIEVKDIYYQKGKIVEGDLSGDAEEVIDAAGKYVVPGLIDLHAHYYYGGCNLGINADIVCPGQGVTTSVDAGSAGIMNFDSFYRSDITRAMTELKAYINMSPEGVKAAYKHGETCDPDDMLYEEILGFFKKYPDVIKGLKLRISKETTEGYGLAPLEKSIEIANKIKEQGYPCIVAVHVANIPKDAPIEGVLKLLRKGDSYTHLYQNLGETIFDENRRVKKCLYEARKRGVLFETGNGNIHWSINNLTDAYEEGFYPDIISSDLVQSSIWKRPSYGLINAMNTSLMCGMDQLDILRAVTYNPAAAIGMEREIGTLETGSRADIAILDIMDVKQTFFDRFGGERESQRVFVPLMTIRGGKPVFRQSFF